MSVIKNLQSVQKKYVMASLYCTDYSETSGEVDITNSLTDKGKLQFVANALKAEAFHDYNIKKFHGNRQSIIGDHLQGLPSYVNIPFENYEIIKQGKEWGYDLSTDSKENKFCENWFSNVGGKIVQLMEKHGVEIKNYSLSELDFNDGMKKVDETAENISNTLPDELKKEVGIVEHDDATYIYFNPELKNQVNKALEPLLSEKSLENLVAKVDEFKGLNKEDLEFLGFEKARSLKLGDEYHVEYSSDLVQKLNSLGYDKTWGHEGLTTSFATFSVDNNEHPDFGKTLISVRECESAETKLANDETEKSLAIKKFKFDVVTLNGMDNRKIIDEASKSKKVRRDR